LDRRRLTLPNALRKVHRSLRRFEDQRGLPAARRINNSVIFPKIYGERFVKRPPLS
jgi:hypothetical protein